MKSPMVLLLPSENLFCIFQQLDDNKTLGDCGFTSSTARAQAPATIGLACKDEGL